ncbi:MAG: hypothetical protein M1831_007198 [Alyxoria varia]|nr:MAG: hypothetical protein M1831_007198 [Alyxoria varia]
MFSNSEEDKKTWRERLEAKIGRLIGINFITVHYAYFIFGSLFTALVFWGSSTTLQSISFTDALFFTTSAFTDTGLNTVNLSEINTWQQVILFGLMICGSQIFVSGFVVLVRLQRFEKTFRHVIKRRKEARRMKKKRNLGRAKSLEQVEKEEQDDGFDVEQGLSRQQSDEKSQGATVSPTNTAPNDEVFPGANSETSSDAGDVFHAQTDGGRDRALSERSVRFEPQSKPSAPRQPLSPVPENAGLARTGTQITQAGSMSTSRQHRPLFSFTGVGATANAQIRHRTPSAVSGASASGPSLARARTGTSSTQNQTNPFFHSAAGYFGRNSQVHGLSLEERQELGGYEYSAIMLLAILVPFYLFIWQFLGALAFGAWVKNYRPELTRGNGLNPWWVGAFTSVSAFNNSGMMLLDANMVAFQDSPFMLISTGLFVLAGNTAYPIILRAAVWTIWKVLGLLPNKEFWDFDRKALRFLLDHPRRCYTNMFPSTHTWWLFGVLLLLNIVDWVMFEILNIGNDEIHNLSIGTQILGGLFQAIAVRAGGFYVFAIATLRISLQVLYVIMMYISVYPVTITMRNSNVYEESSLGLFAEDSNEDEQPLPVSPEPAGKLGGIKRRMTVVGNVANAHNREDRTQFVRQQVRAQLSHDLWWVVLALFVIMIIEGSQFERNPETFSVFNFLFEVISAYGNVGLSVGVPYDAYSFSGAWRTLSKLVLIAVMLRGRHRGLPVAIDQAIKLPGLKDIEAEVGAMEPDDEPLTPVTPATNLPTARNLGRAGTFTMAKAR